mmetsp:Transcript_16203/g.37271  ORF Transcript_16203/g.37271 Transcript_16203/m.37271 type:complete len:881 (-) Transcript_16203:45-2687(-)
MGGDGLLSWEPTAEAGQLFIHGDGTDAWFDGSVMDVAECDLMDLRSDAIALETHGISQNSELNRTGKEVQASFHDHTTKEPSHEEITEYLDKHQLQSFLSEVTMWVARHFPPDPLDFLLMHLPALVARHRSAHGADIMEEEALSPGGELSKEAVPDEALQMPPPSEKNAEVVQRIAAVLQHSGVTRASAGKLLNEFAGPVPASPRSRNESVDEVDGPALEESGFVRLAAHLRSSWGLSEVDAALMARELRRWRFRANAARGTRGMPLWPMAREDFIAAYPAMLRAVRDRYVPIGGRVHRSIFVKRAAGTLLDRYELGPRLGRGAFGEVRLVTQKATGEKRVCKSIAKKLQRVPPEALADEVEMLRALDHPHIIRVFEFFEDENVLEMLMEPIFGGTLTQFIQGIYSTGDTCSGLGSPRPPELTEGWIATVLTQLVSALTYAHTVVGLIHKDLKTDNVLLVGKSNSTAQELLLEPVHAMLADFGIAEVFAPAAPHAASPHSIHPGSPMGLGQDASGASAGSPAGFRGRSNRVGGTPSYMSPEMYRGSFTEKSDMWSLGVVAFQMLSGEMPYRARNIFLLGQKVLDSHSHPAWDRLRRFGWSLGARQFCQQLLLKDEALRPTAPEAARDAWLAKASASYDNPTLQDDEKLSLHMPHLQSHLMKMARSCITSQLNLSQLHRMNARFKYYDVSGDGRLNSAEVRQVLEDLGVSAGDDVELIVESLDTDHSGLIEYSEFVASCIDLSSEAIRQQLQIVFSIFDLDGSGSITLEELRQVLTQGPSAHPTKAPTAEPDTCFGSLLPDGTTVEALMLELDRNGDGTVQFIEFERYLLDEHRKQEQSLSRLSTSGCCNQSSRPRRPKEARPVSRRPCLSYRRRGHAGKV